MIFNEFSVELGDVDLNAIWHASDGFRGGACERRQDAVCPTDGFPAVEHVRADRFALWRRSSCAGAFVRRTVSGHGFRAVDLPGEPARHRDLSVGSAVEAGDVPFDVEIGGQALPTLSL